MKEMGITDREGFDLVMTHEGAHRALQFMEGRYNSQQEELCCDFMAGVRAGLNGMDEGKIIRSLEDTLESDSHPDGLLRAEAISSGAQYAKEYMAINNEAPSFSECLERFDKKLDEMSGNLLNATQEINLMHSASITASSKPSHTIPPRNISSPTSTSSSTSAVRTSNASASATVRSTASCSTKPVRPAAARSSKPSHAVCTIPQKNSQRRGCSHRHRSISAAAVRSS